jgi:mannose-1-phosphate guanylyltransferase
MAGGSGERFWPLSTKEKPKQLLPLISDKSMIRETIDRLEGLVKSKDIYVATNAIQVENLRKELTEIPEENIIIEPAFRDTAAAILYGSTYISVRNTNPVIVVLASDHSIKNVKEFQKALLKANDLANNSNKIITLGIKPTYPETGYGYIKVTNNEILSVNLNVQFEEKPNLEKAKLYFEDGHYLWNSGMFIFKYSSLLKEFKIHSPEHIEILDSLRTLISKETGLNLSHNVFSNFQNFPKISIDFAIMEKSNNIICLPTDFGWSDVGSFFSIYQTLEKDISGNVFKNLYLYYIDSNNNFILSDNDKITFLLLEVNNMLIIYKEEKFILLPLSQSQFIKKLKNLYE